MEYRSVLFVPGHEKKKIKKAYTLDADLVVIDLESTVPDNEKKNAKKIIKNCNVDKKKTYIRINNNEDLDFVVLVGGSSRIKKFQALIKEITNKDLEVDLNPDEIVSNGAALFAEVSAGTLTKNIVVDLLHISSFKKMHISLMDIDETRLKLAKELIDRAKEYHQKDLEEISKKILSTDVSSGRT